MNAVIVSNPQRLDEIFKAWSKVVGLVNKLLEAHTSYGFNEIEENVHPSIADMVLRLRVADAILGVLSQSGDLDHEETRLALNARQFVLLVQLVAKALEENDEAEYLRAMGMLNGHAKI